MLLDDLLGVAGVGKAIPDGFWIDDQDGSVFTLIEAAGFVDADAMFEPGGFDGILERATELLAVFTAAARAVCGFVTLV